MTRLFLHTLYITPRSYLAHSVPPIGFHGEQKCQQPTLFLTICSKSEACSSHRHCDVKPHPWCAWHVEREGGGRLTRGPGSILHVTMDAHTVRLVSLMCVTLAWWLTEGRGGERRGEEGRGRAKGEGEGDEARGEGDPPHLGWRRRELYPCAWLMV